VTRILSIALFLAAPVTACDGGPAVVGQHPAAAEARVDGERLIEDIRTLAADTMEGRRTGTLGSERARAFLRARFEEVGVQPFGSGFEQPFEFTGAPPGALVGGVNLVGHVIGVEHPERYIVVTAHYDHLGVHGGALFYGADDNASGIAALLALAAYFREHPPRHTLVFAALDAEEGPAHGGIGLQGARAFVRDPTVAPGSIILNVNMDMISRNERDELWAAGTYHYPALAPLVEEAAERAQVTLRMGFDRPGASARDDWTMLSDHGAFHEAGIPFVYFGVEDHADYHRPTDTFENIDPDFYLRSVESILEFLLTADRTLGGQRPAGR
jgi:hypothetical protein